MTKKDKLKDLFDTRLHMVKIKLAEAQVELDGLWKEVDIRFREIKSVK